MESAARIAALHCSATTATATDQTTACTLALGQLRNLPNVPSTITTCAASPVTVTATLVASGPDSANAAKVAVSYVAPVLGSIPGIIPGQYTVTRTITMKVRGS